MTKGEAIAKLKDRLYRWRIKLEEAEADEWQPGIDEALEEMAWCRNEIENWRKS
jgi:hypothetical protein